MTLTLASWRHSAKAAVNRALFENIAAVEMAFVVEGSMGWIVIHF